MRPLAVEVDDIAATAEAVDIMAEAADVTAAAAIATDEAEVMAAEAADADDDAILDMIALEMAAPDPDDDDFALEMDGGEIYVAEAAPAEDILVAEDSVVADEPEPMAAAAQPPAVRPSPQASQRASVEPEPSLGSSLIASGILQRPQTASDWLAPIRRMSQAEKIAFFS